MNSLSFDIGPSVESNDHETRIHIDGVDWLEEWSLGIDPTQFFRQESLSNGGRLLIGRCDCGCVGCSDVFVDVVRKGPCVFWLYGEGTFLTFRARDYDQAILEVSSDHSWEDYNRRAECFAEDILRGTILPSGHLFDWASARIEAKKIKVSFTHPSENSEQRMLEFQWDGSDYRSAREGARRLRATIGKQCAAPQIRPRWRVGGLTEGGSRVVQLGRSLT